VYSLIISLIGQLNGQTETIQQFEKETLYVLKNPYKLLLAKDPLAVNKSHWLPDSSTRKCTHNNCNVNFDLFNRKSHCRKCGEVFCSLHLEKVTLSPLEKKRDLNGIPTRICQSCTALIDGRPPVYNNFQDAVLALGQGSV
jgi:hypothetical protein